MITLRRNNVVKVVDSEEKAAKLVKDGFEMVEDEIAEDENTEATGTIKENTDTLDTASDNTDTSDTVSDNADDESLDDIEKPSKKGKKNAKSGDTDS